MIRKYNKVFITGDLHLGDITFEQEAKLVEKLKQDKFDLVVFGGDTFDTWRKSLPEILSRYDQLFKFLQRMKSKVVFIRGNHDMEIDYLKKLGFGVRKNLKYTTPGGKKIKIIHGHEFDKDCARWEFITRKAVFVEEKLNRLLKKFDNEAWIRMARLMGNVDMARFKKRSSIIVEWTLWCLVIHIYH